MRISTVQSKLAWEDKEANLSSFSKKIAPLVGKTDLVLLPEMFTTGFTMNPEKVAEPMSGKSVNWMRGQAAKLDAVVCGSLIVEEDGNYFNRLVWMRPDSSFEIYDKRHLFTLAGEHIPYQAGSKKLIVELKGWKICPLVCYDLRFPVWSRNVEDYDLLIYVANWPRPRAHHWKTLLTARAIENQCYLAGVNRVGTDANDLHYQGDTSIIDYTGNVLYHAVDVEDVITLELSKEKLMHFRSKLNFLADRDTFEIARWLF